MFMRPSSPRRFQLVLIKPSHYDDDGYVIQWLRSIIPSNSLAVLYGLADDCAKRRVLGPDVAIDMSAMDESNTPVKIKRLIAQFRRHDNFGLVVLVGVQSNQFPRALDIARPLRAAGIAVAVGGFHVSGCLSMLDGVQADLQAATDMGVTLFAGELEGRCDTLLQDAANGALKPLYNFLDSLPGLHGVPMPFLPRQLLRRTLSHQTSFDAGRGCPFQCSFCTIINVQGRQSRQRSADDVEQIVRANIAQGVRWFFVTDDNLARNNNWESIFDRLIELREKERLNIKLIVQVDTLCHKIPNFIEKAGRAGVRRAFLGLESINPANLLAAKKRQNKITEYRQMLLAWKKVGVMTYAGYILGFPNDTVASILEDIEIIKKELPIDILEFFFLTPLPGSEDHQVLWKKGVAMDPDMNKYDLEHAVTAHPNMSKAEWEQAYELAWRTYYTPEHIETILRRGGATNTPISNLAGWVMAFSSGFPIERLHPLQAGVCRIKRRTDRRPGLPLEPVWAFYPKYLLEMARKLRAYLQRWQYINTIRRRVKNDPNRHAYTDRALTPVTAEDVEVRELFTHNEAARAAVRHARKIAALTRSEAMV